MGFTLPGFGFSQPKKKSNLEIFKVYQRNKRKSEIIWGKIKYAKIGEFTVNFEVEPSVDRTPAPEVTQDERIKIGNHFPCGHSIWQGCDCPVLKTEH